MQEDQLPESIRHSKVAPASEENEKLAEVEVVEAAGWAVIVVSGAVVSTVQVLEAGVASTLPAVSMARTEKVWEPSERLV